MDTRGPVTSAPFDNRRPPRHPPAVIGLLICVVGMSAATLTAQSRGNTPVPPTEAQAAALRDFQQRLDEYVKMRTRLALKLVPLAPTASASELTTRQESLTAALREARKTAKQGDLIPIGVASQLRTIIAADFKQRNPEARQAAFEEVPAGFALVINRTYPAKEALPTVPPLLLAKLPVLPDDLQYRFVGRHLVILDGDTQMIVDYASNVLPPR